ncbi:glutamate receptor ionotropic, kainate 3-like [Haemaphysalis longicornis]
MLEASAPVRPLCYFLCCVLLQSNLATGLPETIYIGALLEGTHEDRGQELALRYAIDRINNNNAILPASRLQLLTQRLPPGDAFHAFKTVCSLVEKGTRAVLSLQSSQAAAAVVQSACARFNVPFLRLRNCDSGECTGGGSTFAVSFYPDPREVSKALLDLVLALDWSSFTLVFRNQSSFTRLNDVIKYAHTPTAKVRLVQCSGEGELGGCGDVLKDLRRKRELRLLLDLTAADADAFMKRAVKESMVTPYHQYILTSMDLHTLSWWREGQRSKRGSAKADATTEAPQPARRETTAGVYGFRLLDPEQRAVHEVIREWNFGELLFGRRVERSTLSMENALIYDAVSLLARSFHDLDRSQSIETHRLSCWDPDAQGPWPHGRSLVSYMKMVQVKGLTGDVRLGEQGNRRDFTLDIVKLQSTGFQKVGAWTREGGLTSGAPPLTSSLPPFPVSVKSGDSGGGATTEGRGSELQRERGGGLRHRQLLRVTAIVHPPYVIARPTHRAGPPSVNGSATSSARVRYTGFAVQLLDMVASALGLEYEIRASVDGSDYGSLSAREGRWTGLVREVFEREADLAIGDISITRERLEYVDFTAPFLQNDLGVLYRNVERSFYERPSFLRPWTAELWLCVASAALATSLMLAFAARLSVAEWVPVKGSSACAAAARRPSVSYRKAVPRRVHTLRNRFTLFDSLWFILGSLLQQGTETFPKALATRIMAVVWWLSALILISSYTASLASQIIAQHLHTSFIQSIGDLAKQSKISYGCVSKSTAKALLKESTDPHLQRVWATMEMAGPYAFFDTVSAGVTKVRTEESFALLMDSQTIEYLIAHDCSLARLPGRLETGGFGFAMPQGSPLRQLFTSKILQLQENGTLRALRERWWSSLPETEGGSARRCSAGSDRERASPGGSGSTSTGANRDAIDIRGLLLVLAVGCLVSVLVVIAECLWRFRCSSRWRNQEPRRRKSRRGVTASTSLQESNLIILDPPKEFQDDQDSFPMTSYKCDAVT